MKKFLLLICISYLPVLTANAQEQDNLPLTETKWILTNLNDKVIQKNEEGLSSFMIFTSDNSFKGFAGCNKFQGSYKNKKGTFSFTNIGSTKMLCENSNNEEEFIKTLNKVVSFKIIKNQLMLKDKTKTVAVFEVEKSE